MRADASATTAFDDCVDDGAALPGVRSSDEHPVFLSDRRGADGVFGEVRAVERNNRPKVGQRMASGLEGSAL